MFINFSNFSYFSNCVEVERSIENIAVGVGSIYLVGDFGYIPLGSFYQKAIEISYTIINAARKRVKE